MSDHTQLVVAFLIIAALTLLSIIGIFVTSPVMAIFAIVFLLMACLVLAELRNHR
jgi:hypothetical protein